MPIQFIQRLTSIQRSHKTNFQLGAYMAFIAGAVNAGGFLAIARYTSHMSGIVSAIGDDLALNNFLAVLGGVSLLLAFLAGAMTTAIMVNWSHRKKIHSEFALPLLLEAILLLVFGLVGANLNFYMPLTIPAIALLLCFVMGLQNAIVTKVSKAEIRTTHMTGVITDMGIEIGKLIYWNKAKEINQHHFVAANREKLKTHTLIFFMFLTGGIAGAISFKHAGYVSVIPLSLSLILIAGLQIYKDIKALFN